jgi:hypothetical protein
MTWSNSTPVIEAYTVIIASGSAGQGLFVYNGQPAAGNLIASIAASAGTDSFGNPYPQGIGSYAGGLALQPSIIANSGQLRLSNSPSTAPGDGILEPLFPTGGVLLSSGHGSLPDAVQVQYVPGNTGVTTGNSLAPQITYLAADVLSPVDQYSSGSWIHTALDGTPDTWQTPTYGNGWAGGTTFGGTVQNLQFRRDMENNLYVSGVFHTTSASPATTAFTLPAGYRPTVEQRVPAILNAGPGTITATMVRLFPSGAVQVFPTPTASGEDVQLSVSVPLGNIA